MRHPVNFTDNQIRIALYEYQLHCEPTTNELYKLWRLEELLKYGRSYGLNKINK